GKNLAVVLIVAARTVGEPSLAARMLLPVRAPFRALAARPVELALAAISVAIPARTIEFRTILTIEPRSLAQRPVDTGTIALRAILATARKPRALVAAAVIAGSVKTRLVETRPRTALAAVALSALLPRFGFPMRRPVAEILARPITEFAVGEPAFA